jgi:hypothetical protein
MDFERLLSEIPWLREIPDLRSKLRFVPLTTKEKITTQYGDKDKLASVREWIKFPFSLKKQYLVLKKKKKIFTLSGTKLSLIREINIQFFLTHCIGSKQVQKVQ